MYSILTILESALIWTNNHSGQSPPPQNLNFCIKHTTIPIMIKPPKTSCQIISCYCRSALKHPYNLLKTWLTAINNEVRLIISVSIVSLTIVSHVNDKLRGGKRFPKGPAKEKWVIPRENKYNTHSIILVFCFFSFSLVA